MFRDLIRSSVFLSIFLSIFLAFVFSTVFWASSAQATTFTNQYVSFELPNNWNCKLEGTEWLCVSQLEKQAKEAIIILTAKEVGPSDNLAAYKAHLQTPRALTDPSGKTVASQVLNVRETQINGHTWVDGMQLGSEISSYYTRYLATTKDKLAIAVTFSAHKNHYTKYSQDFLKAVQSLRVVASRDLLSPRPNGAVGTNERIGSPTVDPIPYSAPIPLPAEPKSGGWLRYLIGLIFIAAAIGYYFYSKRK